MKTNPGKVTIRTNQLIVEIDYLRFFGKYTIISYENRSDKKKNLAYEKLSNLNFIAVAGIYARWIGNGNAFTRFFILTDKQHSGDILSSLKCLDNITCRSDDLQTYDKTIRKRIVASLALNSLSSSNEDDFSYNNANLYMTDTFNFFINDKRGFVCLKFSINKSLQLAANTVTFSKTDDEDKIMKHILNAFRVQFVYNQDGSSYFIMKPVDTSLLKDKNYTCDIYIQKNPTKSTKNTVPYWYYDRERFSHGKLPAISKVMELLNSHFEGIISFDYSVRDCERFELVNTAEATEMLIADYFCGKCIVFNDPFRNEDTLRLSEIIRENISLIVGNTVQFPEKAISDEMVVSFCLSEDEEKKYKENNRSTDRLTYVKGADRKLLHSDNAVQHTHTNTFVLFPKTKAQLQSNKATARRILLDLMVKELVIGKTLPPELFAMVNGWSFYMIRNDMVYLHGGIMQVSDINEVTYSNFGIDGDGKEMDIDIFCSILDIDRRRIEWNRDFLIASTADNVYLIETTDEIPILNYEDVIQQLYCEDNKPHTFKRAAHRHDNYEGYIGFHTWFPEDARFAYIPGCYPDFSGMDSIGSCIIRMPHVRKIHVIRSSNPISIENDIEQLVSMLKYGLGRWKEVMAYPFPFKFLYEYLDAVCLSSAHECHWDKLSFKNE